MKKSRSLPLVRPPIVVCVSIVRGEGESYQRQAWRKFWQKLISEVKANER